LNKRKKDDIISNYAIDYLLIAISIAIALGSQFYINSWFSKTKKIKNKKGVTGKEVAREILDKNGLKDVRVQEVQGVLSDHYDPRNKTVNLSPDIYDGQTIAAISVASHECGHAIQDKDGYVFLRIRSMIVPLVNLASKLGYVAILVGIILGSLGFVRIGIIMEVIILVFQLVTLPVEFNASKRALIKIKEYQIVDTDEHKYAKGMLTSAALTYVASVAATLVQILRLALIFTNNER